MELDASEVLETQIKRSRFFKVKAVLDDIYEFGGENFLKLLKESKIKIPNKSCVEVKEEELDTMIAEVITVNLHPQTRIWGTDTFWMSKMVSDVSDLLSYEEAAFDHTGIQFGHSTRSFTRAPRGVKDVFKAKSINPKLSLTYVLCASKKHGILPGYYIIPENVASKAKVADLQTKGVIPNHIK